jgi:S-adenosylmethionine synthetase
MRVLITGASGLLGRELMTAFRTGNELLGLSHSRPGENMLQTDLRDGHAFAKIMRDFRPEVLIHSAAYRDPDYCAQNRNDARLLNIAPLELMLAKLPESCRIVLISSDYVFDGRNPPYHEQDERNPLNFYGKTKVAGEDLIAARSNSLALRVPVLIGADDSFEKSGFVFKLVSALRSDSEAALDDLHIRYPTWTRDVAVALRFAVDKDVNGTLHYSGRDGGTQYRLALQLAELLGKSAVQLRPIEGDSERQASRPIDSQLATDRIRSLGFKRFTPFVEAVEQILADAAYESGARVLPVDS